ncbi:hypothetical protein ABPG74_000747 [Tetrahymena malaccensis]
MASLPTEQKGEDSPFNGIKIEMTDMNTKNDSNNKMMSSSKHFSRYQSKMRTSVMFSKIENENNYDIENYSKKQKPNKENYEIFKKKIDNLHMRKFNPKTKQFDLQYDCCGDVFCDTEIPGHCCWSTSKATAVDERGVGITLYFKSLKHLIWNYLFFVIISAPILFFCLYSSKESSIEINSFQSFLQSSTVGNIGQDARQCFKDAFLFNTTTEYVMKCSTGNLAMSQTFAWGLFQKSKSQVDYEQQDCNLVDDTKLDKSQNNDIKDIPIVKKCQDQTSCTFSKADILGLFKTTDFTNSQFYAKAYCQGTYFTFPYYNFPKKYVAYIIAGIDAFIVLWYFLMVYFQGSAEEKAINNILKKKRTPSHFTIQITNLPPKIKSEADLMADLQEHIQKSVQTFANKERKNLTIRVIDVKISESQQEIIQQRKKGIIYKENLKRIYQFLEKYDKDSKIISNRNKVTIQMLQELIENLQHSSIKKKAAKELKAIETAYVDIGKTLEKIDKIENKSSIKYAWVTFETIENKTTAIELYQTTTVERCCAFICGCCDCCVPKEKVFQKKVINVKDAPNPDSILWENNDSSALILRKIISVIITLAVVVGSYVLIVWIRNRKQDLMQQYPSVDCSNPIFDNIDSDQGKKLVEYENNQPSGTVKVGYIYCYCKTQINEIFSGSLSQPYKGICNDWLTSYTLSQFLPYAAVLCIVVINVIIQFLFQALSQFEKHKLLDDQLKSFIIKTFVAQFINTGLILLLTNINFDITTTGAMQFLFGGNYDDLSPEWFKNVGTVIILTLLINVVTAPMVSCFFVFLRALFKCCDRGCSLDDTKTKKSTLNEWVEFYTGPEFMISFRYSQILGICFIGMLYSGGIPILYFISLLHLTVLYWLDKVFLFKVCKIPPNFDQQMATMARTMLYLVPFLHTIFSIYIYGNTDIFFEIQYLNQSIIDISSSNQIAEQFIVRVLQRQQNIAHGIILALLLLMFLLRTFLYRPIKACFSLCLHKTGMEKYLDKSQYNQKIQPYYKFMSGTQLKDDYNLLEFYLMEQEEKEDEKQSQKFQEQVKEKQQLIKKYYPEQKKQASDIVGIFSYDIRHNPLYRKLYGWDKRMVSPDVSMAMENQNQNENKQLQINIK